MLKYLLNPLPAKTVFAHCDIPCGIYDPHQAQVAAHSVLRMTQMILDAKIADPKELTSHIARLSKVKEDHAEIVKHEVRVIWGDYFKPEHLEKYPDLHDKVFNIMKLASKARQTVDLEAAQKLVDAVLEFAELFYQTKGVEPMRVKSVYPTEGEIVLYN